ncbi:multi-sensor signal transduction histidine kinase [Methanoregula boonei 6A8]|uniref:histidine kinase n=1 Tax=Methanoregula boonei (strain DSM 21154 / JCM 14090 / 6A8) TaxID=456442 RepID=A7I4M3_METB6|nr:PAS domain S-box protein [Methanoregula boonei]ABS54684.1 multi-sensor signal transduction histidine kinase [Methanoregula boonei 6A8]
MISVVCVDDEPDLLEIARLFLERSGEIDAMSFVSAQEALDSPAILSCDIVVSDYQMPGMDGIAFLKEVRMRFGDLPFILFTGRGREEIVIEAINNGADFYLQKGGDPTAQFAELLHKIRQAVRRKEAERSQHESEQRLANIIDFLPDAILAVDRTGRVIAWNRTNENITGVPASGILGKGDYEYALSTYGERRPFLLDMIYEPDEKILKYYTNIVHDGGAISAETSLAAPKGRRIDIMAKASPLYNQKGEVTGAIEVIRDITALKKIEQDLRAAYERVTLTEEELRTQYEELRQTNEQLSATEEELTCQVNKLAHSEQVLRVNEERLAMAQAVGRTGSWEYRLDTGTIWGSAEGLRIFGYPATARDLPIEDIESCIPERERVHQALVDLIASGKDYDLEYTIRPADGSGPKVIHSVARLERDARGIPVRVIGVIQDTTERRKAYEDIAFKNTLLATQQETAPDGILIVDETGKILSYNRKFAELWKIPQELIEQGRDVLLLQQVNGQLVDPEKFLARVRYLYEHNDEKSFEELSLRDGRILERFSSPVFGENKKYYGRIWYFRDITGRRNADKAVLESEKKFATVFKSSPIALTLVSATDGTFFDVNDAFLKDTGYTREEVIGKTAEDLRLFSDARERENLISVLQTGKSVYGMDLQCRGKSGEIRTCRFTSQLLTIDNKAFRLFTSEDITERKHSEEARRESEKRFRDLVETLPDIVWEIDLQGKIRYISPTVERVMGYTPEELEGGLTSDLVAEQRRDFARRELGKYISNDSPLVPFEIPARHCDGHEMMVEIRASRVKDSEGKVTGFRGVTTDVTRRWKSEEALRRANRQLTLLGSVTRHDVLNRITVLLGYLAIVKRKCTDPGQEAYLQKMESAIDLLRAQMEFTRIYQDVGSHEPRWIELEAVIPRDQVPEMVSLVPDVQGFRVYADAMFEKVFANLLDNSIRHGGHVTEIRVTCHPEGTALVIAWEDNGVGVRAGKKEQIFRQGVGSNTGLGLFLIREILALTGIEIRETGEPGSGARFEIVVPEGLYLPART